MSSDRADPFPVPPFPHPEPDILRVVVENAMAEYESGEVGVKGAIVHTAVHAWFESHLEGEYWCPGCKHRGEADRGIFRDNFTRDAMRQLRGRLESLGERGFTDDEKDGDIAGLAHRWMNRRLCANARAPVLATDCAGRRGGWGDPLP